MFKIGQRIKELRKIEGLTQKDFAEYLKVKPSYISMLEKNKNLPSERLLLSICSIFGINYEWLKEGSGDRFKKQTGFTQKGLAVVEEIDRVVRSEDRNLPLTAIAAILNIDAANMPKKLNLPKEFPDAIQMLVRIFKEGDPKKIKSVMSLFEALLPKPDPEEIQTVLKEEWEKIKGQREDASLGDEEG